jgi:hypothetical protein
MNSISVSFSRLAAGSQGADTRWFATSSAKLCAPPHPSTLTPASGTSAHAADQTVVGDVVRREERLQCVEIDRESDLIQDGAASFRRHPGTFENRVDVLPVVPAIHLRPPDEAMAEPIEGCARGADCQYGRLTVKVTGFVRRRVSMDVITC